MRKIVKYNIAAGWAEDGESPGRALERLVQEADKLIKLGFEPHGSVMFTSENKYHHVIAVQAMVLYKKEKLNDE